MSQQRKGGLGRGLAALIPTSPEENPRLGDSAADVILGPRAGGPKTTPPRSRRTAAAGQPGTDAAAGDSTDAAGATAPGTAKSGGTKAGSTSGKSAANTAANTPASSTAADTDQPDLVDPGAVYREIPLASIEPNPKQPRAVFDEEALGELTHSIREFGLLQPIVVREIGGGRHQLIMGERRWRASQLAELETIPAIVRQADDEDLLRDALLENIHRVQLNPLEEAAAYQQLLEEFGVTQSELATRIGRSRPAITNSIRLLALPTAVQRRVAAGVLSAGHARALLALEAGHAAQDELAARIVAEGLSVRATEELVTIANSDGGGKDAPERKPAPGRKRDPELDGLASRLSDRFETKVSVSMGRRKGRITIDVGDAEDLRRVVELLGLGD